MTSTQLLNKLRNAKRYVGVAKERMREIHPTNPEHAVKAVEARDAIDTAIVQIEKLIADLGVYHG